MVLNYYASVYPGPLATPLSSPLSKGIMGLNKRYILLPYDNAKVQLFPELRKYFANYFC